MGTYGLKFIICDDNPQWRARLKALCSGYLAAHRLQAELQVFASGETLYAEPGPYDLAVLDLDLRTTRGDAVARVLREANPAIELIFVSELVQYATVGYELDAIHYLIKADLDERSFARCLDRALERLRRRLGTYAIPTDAGLTPVPVDDLMYIESTGRQLVFHLTQHQRALYTCYGKLDNVEQDLGPCGFLRIHRSYLVNYRHIVTFGAGQVILADGSTLPVSRRRYKELIKSFTYLMGCI